MPGGGVKFAVSENVTIKAAQTGQVQEGDGRLAPSPSDALDSAPCVCRTWPESWR